MFDHRFKNKVCVVTGAATGIGRACAIRFGAEGACVVIDYVNQPDKAKEVISEIEAKGSKAEMVQADVSVQGEVERLFSRAVSEFGRVDILVNNAGIEKKYSLVETPLSEWDHIVNVDLRGPWMCTQIAARQMIEQGQGGRIINISSVHEDMAMPYNIPYCAAKGGLRMLTRTICEELAKYNITVNNIAPGAIDTPIDQPVKEDPKKYEALIAEIPMKRMGKPDEVAGLCAWLASDEAAYVTGSTYVIDGGLMRHAKSL